MMQSVTGLPARTLRAVSGAALALLIGLSFLASGSFGGTRRAVTDRPEPVQDYSSAPVSQPVSSSEEKLTEETRATISATGDVIGHDALLEAARTSGGKYNFDFVYKYLKKYASASDYAVTNLETTLGGGPKYSGYPAFSSPDSLVDSITGSGFDMLLTANNHANDTGYKGMYRTAKVLNSKKVDFIGTVENESDKRYLVREVNGIKLGMICYTYEGRARKNGSKYLNDIIDNRSAAILNTFNVRNLDEFYTELGQRMEAMRSEGAEAIVIFMHWGVEYELEVNADQKKIAQKLCDLGADVIIGGHPHVVQGMELLKDSAGGTHRTVCIYSMGNSVSNQRKEFMQLKSGHTEDGVFISFTFTRYSDGSVLLTDVDALPTWVNVYRSGNWSKRVFEIIPLDKSVKDWAEAFSLDEAGLAAANASYKRTMDIIGSGLDEAREYCRLAAENKLNTAGQ